jgi:hypothetical protein
VVAIQLQMIYNSNLKLNLKMKTLPSCLQWRKEYYYFDNNGDIQKKSLHWFQRVLRVIGFYENTTLASIARECLMPRQWHAQDRKNIKELIGRVGNCFPKVIWTEQFPDNTKKKISISTNGNNLTISSYTNSWFAVNPIATIELSTLPLCGEKFGIYFNPQMDQDYIPKIIVKMTSNSREFQTLYWKEAPRNYLKDHKVYGFILNQRIADSETLYSLSKSTAHSISQGYSLTCPFALDFFRHV